MLTTFIVPMLILAALIAITATAMLALGSLLAHLFVVSTFEATVVVLAITAAVALIINASPPISSDTTDILDPEEEPIIVFNSLPLPTPHRPRRRKR